MVEERKTLRIERDGHVAIVILDRMETSNALNTAMGRELTSYFEDLAMDPEQSRCVILTGAGSKAFCAGGDLKERRGMTDDAWTAQHIVFERMARAIVNCPVPVIAAINGAAYGGGCEIALACDFIHASETAHFALTEVTLGIIPGAGGTQTLARAVGERRARELIFSGQRFTARQAMEWGLANAVHPDGDLREEVFRLAHRIAANAPLAVRQAKTAISRGAGMALTDGMALEIEAYHRLIKTADRVEGVEAFNEKRPPVFNGR